MKTSIVDMQRLASAKGGRCLSPEYIRTDAKLLWQCKEGHQWEAVPSNIKRGHWCPACARGQRRRGTIDEMRNIAHSRGGRCLSTAYIRANAKLLWQCKEGHQWQALPNSVKRGSWCPVCATMPKHTIEEMQRLAEARGGKCLSEAYINNLTKLTWQCREGHQWEALPNNVKRGSWCPVCVTMRNGTIDEMKRIAEARGGECLSQEYINNKTKLIWQCKEGHQWQTTPSLVRRGQWCPACAAGQRLGTIDEMRQIAHSRGGQCLSREYIRANAKLLWQCKEAHQWEAIPNNIKRGSWCPVCATMPQNTIEEMQRLAKARGGKCLSEEYINSLTKLTWQCREGHQWQAAPVHAMQGQWCSVCAEGQRRMGMIDEMRKIAQSEV
jgi:queuine/archaeosine tRNA-ribosyltransferase